MRRAVEPSRGSLARGWELDIRAQLSFFLRGDVDADDHHGLAQCTHALDHVRDAWRFVAPERDEHIASLGHLVITAHACGLPEALPVGLEALPRDLFAPGPTLPECVSARRTTREDLRDAGAIRRQHLAQVLVVGERV
jgi:hypothetical protein